MGNLPVTDIPAKVLFDTGASHSFMSYPFASKHNVDTEILSKVMQVVSPGKLMTSSLVAPMFPSRWATIDFWLNQLFLVTLILILFSGWTGFISTRLSLIVLPGKFN